VSETYGQNNSNIKRAIGGRCSSHDSKMRSRQRRKTSEPVTIANDGHCLRQTMARAQTSVEKIGNMSTAKV
jgi:hypothetical protein